MGKGMLRAPVGAAGFLLSLVVAVAAVDAHAQRICTTCSPEVVGDIIHQSTPAITLWVGHASFLSAPATVGDVGLFRGSQAISLNEKIDGYVDTTFWGAKRPVQFRSGLSDAQRSSLLARARFFAAHKNYYDGNHFNQKGAWFEPTWYRREGYWEFDCVGFVERLYEDFGVNLTPNDQETGADWPLMPREQRDSPYVANVGE